MEFIVWPHEPSQDAAVPSSAEFQKRIKISRWLHPATVFEDVKRTHGQQHARVLLPVEVIVSVAGRRRVAIC
jgi:hypothetical protein